ncbi:MAG: inositol monophosphatase family protein [Pseudomonadota bacterium]
MANTSPIVSIMIKAAEKAARSLNRDFGEVEQLQVSRKGPADFVTAADKRSEEIIFEELRRARPTYSFLMEESGEVKGEDSEHVWIIDPLDGTHNFMHGIPHWCISIALEKAGEVQAGIVYDPVKDEMFRAEKGTGAFMRNKRIRVSGRNNLEASTFCVGGIPIIDKERRAAFLRELDAVTTVAPMYRRTGSAALDLCYVAAGRFEGYWERGIKAWDVAAGALIVKEAGGMVSTIDRGTNPVHDNNILAANTNVHSDLKKLVRDAAKDMAA